MIGLNMYCLVVRMGRYCSFFFFNDTATTEIYTLSLHDALPIYALLDGQERLVEQEEAISFPADGRDHSGRAALAGSRNHLDRKSTRLNSSHSQISYAVFCLKKKKHQAGACPCSSYNAPESNCGR